MIQFLFDLIDFQSDANLLHNLAILQIYPISIGEGSAVLFSNIWSVFEWNRFAQCLPELTVYLIYYTRLRHESVLKICFENSFSEQAFN